jgi:hypothetical protein
LSFLQGVQADKNGLGEIQEAGRENRVVSWSVGLDKHFQAQNAKNLVAHSADAVEGKWQAF